MVNIMDQYQNNNTTQHFYAAQSQVLSVRKLQEKTWDERTNSKGTLNEDLPEGEQKLESFIVTKKEELKNK
jgi:hypothetical protein